MKSSRPKLIEMDQMDWIRPIWTPLDQNGLNWNEWTEIDQVDWNGQKYQIGLKWTEVVQIWPNEPKWTKIDWMDQIWSKCYNDVAQ